MFVTVWGLEELWAEGVELQEGSAYSWHPLLHEQIARGAPALLFRPLRCRGRMVCELGVSETPRVQTASL